ncbi:MAG: hypothetical protein ACLUZR_08295 [Odoribacter laneus]|uniref:hypothetical protein n=1 Tax=Odoribacter laneus TaxID=626933 RepID=UPI00399B6725
MGREVINSIRCGYCKRVFEIAKEDLEWEHLKDIGECDDDNSLHDYVINQEIQCPHCGKMNKILMKARGKSETNLEPVEIISMERGAYEI